MAIYRQGDHIYTPIYEDSGVMTRVYGLKSGDLIFATQPYRTIEDAKNASKMLINALEKRKVEE